MRRLPHPNLVESEVYSACVSGTDDPALAQAYEDAHECFIADAAIYRERANQHCLFQFQASEWGKDEQIVLGKLTKGSLRKLYEKGMVIAQEGRKYYDTILTLAPLGKCPYCQFGHAETLDHFLAKARYPSFSVIPDNLVPACMRCNKGKKSEVVTAESEMSHPYFEDERIEQEIWLQAIITETDPVTSKYEVACLVSWPEDLTRRVSNYFRDLDLSKRYAIEAASELVSVSSYLTELTTSAMRLEHLNRVARQERTLSKNGWKAALYAALAVSNWYCDTGFAGTGGA